MVEFKFKKILCFVLCISLGMALCGCTTFDNFKSAFIDKPEEVKIVKIGILEPQSGANAAKAADEIKGIELANSIYGFVNGAKIELVYADNQSEVSLCDAAAQSLIEAGAQVILGSYNSVLTLASSDVIKEARIPAIAITNTNPIVTSTNNYYFRVCFTDEYEGNAAANFVVNKLETNRSAVFLESGNDYAGVLSTAYADTIEQLTGEYDATVKMTYPSGMTDFSELFANLQEMEINAVFFPSTIEAAKPVIQSAKDLGYDFTWVGTSRWDGIDVEEVYYTLDYDPDAQSTKMAGILSNAYKERFGEDQVPSESVALGFDAYLLAVAGLNGADYIDDNEQVTMAIEAVTDLEGATGMITMSSSGDPIKEVLVEKYESGSRHDVYTVSQHNEGRE